MARPLPSGWVDTNLANSYAATGALAILCVPVGFGPSPSGIRGKIGDWDLIDNSFASGTFCPPGQAAGSRQVIAQNSSLAIGPTAVWTDGFSCTSSLKGWSPFFTWTDTILGLRLGVTIELINPLQDPPYFAKDFIVRYHWFGDENTTRQTTFAGLSGPIQYMQTNGTFGGTRHPGMTPVDLGATIGNLNFGATVHNQGANPELQVKIRGLGATNTTIDTSGLNNAGVLIGLGGGDVDGYFVGSDTSKADAVMANYVLTEFAQVTKNGAGDIGATVIDADGNLHTTPYQALLAWTDSSWNLTGHSGTRSMAIQSAWAAAQTPALPSDDRTLVGNLDPPQGSGDYLPVSVTIAPSVDVHRPDGGRPSDWVSSDTGILTVSESGGATTFTAAQAGASATRTLASAWKNRVGLLGTGDPAFLITAYEKTKHEAGEDIWGWSTYAFLRLKIEAPSDTALILTIKGTSIAVSDSHETNLSDRIAAYVVTPTPWTKTFAVFARKGEHEYDVDLLFPNEGPRPFYPDRVDSLKLEGFQAGAYTLSAAKLIAKGPGYLKWAWGKQVQRDDYSAWGLAVDGQYVYGKLPDQAVKPDETGEGGGNPRYITPITGTGTGLILDTQYSLEELCGALHNQEGLSVVFSQAVHDARMKDPQGNEFPVELAQFMKPLVPYAALTPGTAYQPDCAVVCGQVEIPNAVAFSLPWRLSVWGGIEALAVSLAEERLGQDIQIAAVGTGATAIGTTDPFGYVVVSPVPANGSELYGLQAVEDPQPILATVALRPRDLPRLPVKANIAEASPWPIETRAGQYQRAFVRQGRVEYRRANHVLPPFEYGSSPAEGLQPRMCRDHRARVRLFYTEQPLPIGNVLQIISDNDGRTFGASSPVLPGGVHPSCCYDARTLTVFAVMYGGGNLYGWRERPNEVPVPRILVDGDGFPLMVEEDIAHVCPAPGGEGRWLLVCRILDEDAISLWQSTNDGATWLRRATLLPGYKHPHVLTDHRYVGLIHVSGYQDGAYAGTVLMPGETSFRGPVTFTGVNGAALNPADTTFGIAAAFEGPARWVLATRIAGEQFISEWWSASMGKTWTRA